MFDIKNINLTEDIQKVKLENGINIILDPLTNFQSTSIGFFLANGSRDENILILLNIYYLKAPLSIPKKKSLKHLILWAAILMHIQHTNQL